MNTVGSHTLCTTIPKHKVVQGRPSNLGQPHRNSNRKRKEKENVQLKRSLSSSLLISTRQTGILVSNAPILVAGSKK